MEEETHLTCPYCFETISMLLDPSEGSQTYIEDCEVCCRPIQVRYEADGQKITSVQGDRAQ